ncbi:MAG: DMT family transporter [Phycisphaerales bacterium]
MIYAKLLLTAIFWGGTFIAGRHVSQHLDPFTIAFLRFAMASALLLTLTVWQEGRLPRLTAAQFVLVALLGATGVFAYNVFFFKGLHLIEAGRASLIVATSPAFIAVTAALFLRDGSARLLAHPLRAAGIPLSILGAIVVISRGNLHQIFAGGVGRGELFILACVFNWVAYSVLGKVAMRHLSPLAAVSYSSAIGALALAAPAVMEGPVKNLGSASWTDWAAVAYLAVFGTVLGFVWFYQGVRAIGAPRAGLFINFVPVSAVLLAAPILHEPITWSLAVGAALVLSGVFLTNRSPKAA